MLRQPARSAATMSAGRGVPRATSESATLPHARRPKQLAMDTSVVQASCMARLPPRAETIWPRLLMVMRPMPAPGRIAARNSQSSGRTAVARGGDSSVPARDVRFAPRFRDGARSSSPGSSSARGFRLSRGANDGAFAGPAATRVWYARPSATTTETATFAPRDENRVGATMRSTASVSAAAARPTMRRLAASKALDALASSSPPSSAASFGPPTSSPNVATRGRPSAIRARMPTNVSSLDQYAAKSTISDDARPYKLFRRPTTAPRCRGNAATPVPMAATSR